MQYSIKVVVFKVKKNYKLKLEKLLKTKTSTTVDINSTSNRWVCTFLRVEQVWGDLLILAWRCKNLFVIIADKNLLKGHLQLMSVK